MKIRIFNDVEWDYERNYRESFEVNKFINKVKVKQIAYSNGELVILYEELK